MKLLLRMQNTLSFLKVLVLVIFIGVGAYKAMLHGEISDSDRDLRPHGRVLNINQLRQRLSHFRFAENNLAGIDWFAGSKSTPRDLVSSIYGALWAYSGWSVLLKRFYRESLECFSLACSAIHHACGCKHLTLTANGMATKSLASKFDRRSPLGKL